MVSAAAMRYQLKKSQGEACWEEGEGGLRLRVGKKDLLLGEKGGGVWERW